MPVGDYTTLPALKATLGITTTGYDSDVSASITGASRAIDNLCQRRFYVDSGTAVAQYFDPVNPWHLDLTADISGTASLVVVTRDDGLNVDTASGLNTWTLNTDFFLEPLNAQANSQSGGEVWPYTRLRVNPAGSFVFNPYFPRSCKVTAFWGWPAVPQPIIDATILLGARLYKMKREAPLGVIALADAAIRIAKSDSNLMLSVGPYMRRRPVVS